MNITVIGRARQGAQPWHLANGIRKRGHAVSVVNTDDLREQLKGTRYFDAVVNKGFHLPLSKIVPKDQDVVIVVQDMYRYENDLDRNETIVAHCFTEPYFAPSVYWPSLWLMPDRNFEGSLCQWYRFEYLKHTIHQCDFPYPCPDLSRIPPHEKRAGIGSGIAFLANIDFSHGVTKCSYWESHALDHRKHYWELGTRMNRITTFPYPQPWLKYMELVNSVNFMLVVPGNQCTINMQLTECLSLGVIPILFVENDEAKRVFHEYGLRDRYNVLFFDNDWSFMEALNNAHELELTNQVGIISNKCKELARTRSYDWACENLDKAIELTRNGIEAADEFDSVHDPFLTQIEQANNATNQKLLQQTK